MDMMNNNGIVMFITKIKSECLSKNDEATAYEAVKIKKANGIAIIRDSLLLKSILVLKSIL